ncbi:sigma-54 dependent transcriptional regulator [uncultured Desulfosarcina sp.]|uniref:sigma-54-dependent transcriptional regulator n=1 Tax=uncultured Desulfosarcina sp. TaxID=218289 RepID=UPI0029C94D28|nr:sigma-54 dependent transcriptional regulator [uncultured Desulfosarcina sp.]
MDKILIIDDKHSILESLEMFFAEKGYRVYKADTGAAGLALFNRHEPDVVILDIRLPDTHGIALLEQIQALEKPAKVIMITAFQDMETTIAAMKLGAYDYIHKPLDVDKVEQAVERALYTLKIDRETPLAAEITQPPNPEVIIGKSDPMRNIFKTIGLLSQNRAPVLIQGETGTGKELIARVIHRNSLFAMEPFITFDCSAIVETLVESELFGHEKGAFTGATQSKAGKIELAGNGTLFLDEIGELPLTMQRKFLGFLQRSEYDRVGGKHPFTSRCRIIAATNRNLAEMVNSGLFRQDLFFRLKVVMIHVPPLADRRTDIPDLVSHFLQKINWELGTDIFSLEKGVIDRLSAHTWPGNVRELENVLVEAVVRARGKVILVDEIETILSSNHPITTTRLRTYSLPHMEKKHIRMTLDRLNWNRSETARVLGISLPTLRNKIRKYGIVPSG